MSDYDTDILVWSERQSELLRRRAGGELVNDTDLDWSNIAEEIESVGRGEFRACESLLRQALIHILEIQAWPQSSAAPGWRAEVVRFRHDAADAFSPSMRQRLDIATLYRRAVQTLPETIDSQPPLPVPSLCPSTLDELLSD
jgi:hypothetical protein